MQRLSLWHIFAISLLVLNGCGSGATSNNEPSPEVDPHAGHDHGHDELGPNGGHLLELGDEEFHAEWLHDDDLGKVTVILLDSEAKREVTTSAESATIDVTVGTEPATQYVLPAVAGDDPAAGTSRFELVELALLTALKIGEGVSAVLTVKVNDKEFRAEIEDHGHDHHGHNH